MICIFRFKRSNGFIEKTSDSDVINIYQHINGDNLLKMNNDVSALDARKPCSYISELNFANHAFDACLRPYTDLSCLHP
jgi:hypothetical protein